MAFPRRLLADHEELILDLRPHWVALVWPIAQVVVILIGALLALRYVPDSWPGWVETAVLVLAAFMLVAGPVRLIVAWLTSHFVVTSDRVIHREGWFAKKSMEMPLERINDVKFKQSVFERIVGAGDLVIESGGEFGQNRFTDIRKPEQVQKTIYEESERNQDRMMESRPPPSGGTERFTGPEHRTTESVVTETTPRAPSIDEQLERLADLRDRGVIDEAEFQDAKDRILGDEPAG